MVDSNSDVESYDSEDFGRVVREGYAQTVRIGQQYIVFRHSMFLPSSMCLQYMLQFAKRREAPMRSAYFRSS